MKKILAMVMAIVMMMAIAVPAFATTETITGGSNAGNDTIITTEKTDIDGNDPTWYTVTIPANQPIFWGETATDVKYSVASQLATGKGVKVTVADADAGYVMTNAGGATLAYTLADTEFTTDAPVFDNTAAPEAVVVNVADSAWKAAAVDAYSDTLTFTATIVDIA